MDENDLLEWAFKGLVSIVLTVGSYLWLSLVKAVGKNRDDLAEHKLHISENYAKKTDIARVFDAIDEVRRDIKTLLIRGGHDER